MKRFNLFVSCLLWSSIGLTQPLDAAVAEVNDTIITKSELDKHFKDTKLQLMATHQAMPNDDVLRKKVLEHLIDVYLQLQVAKNNNIALDDDELDDIMRNIAIQNKLTMDQLKEELVKHGMNWDSYRENLKKEVLLTRTQQQAVGREVHVSDRQVEDYLADAIDDEINQKIFHLQNIVVPVSETPSAQEVADAKNKALKLLDLVKKGQDFSQLAITESSDEYALDGGDLGERHLAELPDIFANVVVKMQANQVQGPIRTPNGWQLIKLVGVNEDALHHQITKTHVKHILIKPGPQMTEVEAERFINNLSRQIKSGKSFDILAKQYSVDAATAIKGGDMGWVVSNELVPQFAEVMEKLKIGQISEPVKSPFGWHIIQVVERKVEDDSKAYQRQKVRAMLQQKKFQQAVQVWQQHLRAQAFINVIDKSLA
ncbi:MAG TPA: molecular chaperone SurA [Legionellales bacterium]|nr:molecular chaperone SurA [Legionellales bacterium]